MTVSYRVYKIYGQAWTRIEILSKAQVREHIYDYVELRAMLRITRQVRSRVRHHFWEKINQ